MQTNERIKLDLLCYSTNMKNAAESADWQTLQEYFNGWDSKLSEARDLLGEEFESISEQLLEDNTVINNCLQTSQRKLVTEFQKTKQNNKSIKQYLK